QALVDIEIADTDSGELIVTPGMRERKGIMDARSDAFLVLPGGIGTLEELFEVWTSRSLGMHDKPVVMLDDGFFAPLWEYLDALRDRGFVRQAALDSLVRARSVAQVLEVLSERVSAA